MTRITDLLSPPQQRFLSRQLRYERAFLYFCGAEIAVATGLLIHMLVRTGFNSSRFALAIVLLLAARGNLKQSKAARLLRTLGDALQAPRNP